jgi:arginyl-tRNA synthetase
MKTTIETLLLSSLQTLMNQGELPAIELPEIKVDRTKDERHGDFATNIALMLSKPMKQSPSAIADIIIAHLFTTNQFKSIEKAGPGFINFFLNASTTYDIIREVLTKKADFGRANIGQGQKVLVEFVSANPTGPLHVGHGRGAAFGASLSNMLTFAGFDVTREYYVNDAGRQMLILATSTWLRYLILCGEPVVFPDNAYKGEYVTDMAKIALNDKQQAYQIPWQIVVEGLPLDEKEGGDKEIYIDEMIQKAKEVLGEEGFNYFHGLALTQVLDDIKVDCHQFGVDFDDWFSEQSLFDEGAIEKSIQALKNTPYTYEHEGALWFKSTDFGDEKDRVLLRANGQPTYFASDVAYHWNKFDRGFERVINIFGADHHGYVARVKAAVKALGHDEDAIHVHLVQFAILYRDGERVQMSTRSGSFVTLRELRDEVGNDATRFFYVMRKPEQHMDFDLSLAKSHSNDNPVYYIQYAHARICSIFRQLESRGIMQDEAKGLHSLHLLTTKEELALMTQLATFPEIIRQCAKEEEPHLLCYYLKQLATALHSYYNAVVILCDDDNLRMARLCLLHAVQQVLTTGLQLLGVSAPESM